MYEFIEYVLSELRNSLGLVILAAVFAGAVTALAYWRWRKTREEKFPWGRAALYLALAGYLAIVLYATLLRTSGGFGMREVNLHLFRAWREAWNRFSAKNWANVLLNVAMFVPLGVLLPALWKRFRKWYTAVPAGFGLSLLIELIQFAVGGGICDVDDLFANTLGAALGWFAMMTLLSLFREKGKRLKPALGHGCLALAVVTGIGSIFLAYAWQPYGNLPRAAAYPLDVGDIVWTLACEWPETEDEAAVYQNQPRSLADCDAFAEQFAKNVGAEFDVVDYYEEAAYYMDHSASDDGTDGAHFLYVSYLDTGYEYHGIYHDDAVWAEGDRDRTLAALKNFPVQIPDFAAFRAEGDGWHSFTVDQHIDGAVMIDGSLRCRYDAKGRVRELENRLLCYTYCREEAIISPEEAYSQLIGGRFLDDMGFLYSVGDTVSVTGCALGYAIDTKGFYQPVYYFTVSSGGYQAQVMIPAMK